MIPMFITPHLDVLLHYEVERLLLHCVLQQMVSAAWPHGAHVVHVVQQLGRQLGGV